MRACPLEPHQACTRPAADTTGGAPIRPLTTGPDE